MNFLHGLCSWVEGFYSLGQKDQGCVPVLPLSDLNTFISCLRLFLAWSLGSPLNTLHVYWGE